MRLALVVALLRRLHHRLAPLRFDRSAMGGTLLRDRCLHHRLGLLAGRCRRRLALQGDAGGRRGVDPAFPPGTRPPGTAGTVIPAAAAPAPRADAPRPAASLHHLRGRHPLARYPGAVHADRARARVVPGAVDRGAVCAVGRAPVRPPRPPGDHLREATAPRGTTVAPFFSLARAAWIPYAVVWDPESSEFHGVEGPRGFASDP